VDRDPLRPPRDLDDAAALHDSHVAGTQHRVVVDVDGDERATDQWRLAVAALAQAPADGVDLGQLGPPLVSSAPSGPADDGMPPVAATCLTIH
jgi:hypothetical protein